MRVRPATERGTLPPGVGILHWTRVPRKLAGKFPEHPISNQPFGEFVASRRLTDQELRDYRIQLVS